MSYAAKLIEMAKEAQGFSSTELAVAMGVKQPTISQWLHSKGSPMSEDRVIELCRLAGIKDYAPWLIGVHAEHLRNREARASLEKLAKQLGAAAVLAVVALLPQGNAHAASAESLTASSTMHYAKLRRWAHALARRMQQALIRLTERADDTSALLV